MSRMNHAGWEEREREMCQRFESSRWDQGEGLGGLKEIEEKEPGFEEKENVGNNDTKSNFDELLFDGNASFDIDTIPATTFVSGTSAPVTRTVPLQEWILLHRPANLSSCSVSQRHVYLQKVTVFFHALISKLMTAKKKLQNVSSTGTDDWEPHPNDIAVPCITVTEIVHSNTKISIESIEFNTIVNFTWEESSCCDEHDEDVLMLHALGRLWYELCMEGEIPSLFSSKKKAEGDDRGNTDDDSDGGIMEMLRILSENEVDREELLRILKEDGGLPAPLCRLICDIMNASGKSITLADVLRDVSQMMESPEAFLFGTITSRWELVFGNNHLFGRKKEMERLMEAASRVEEADAQKEAILISGHAGSGKSSLAQEIRKPLKAKGWTFLRCKFEKTIQSEPLSVVALGLDEFFLSTMPCFPPNGSFSDPTNKQQSIECSCDKPSCPRKVIQHLNNLVGLDGIKALCRWMPCLMRLANESYPVHADYLEYGSSEQAMLEQDVHDTIRFFGVLLEVVASACPVLFFADDVSEIAL